jgi:hypothetical protein
MPHIGGILILGIGTGTRAKYTINMTEDNVIIAVI